MEDSNKPEPGSIGWTDLTVDDAELIRDFYSSVVGWSTSPVNMGDYADFNMNEPGTDTPVAGVCHARGSNADLPPVWLMYVNVVDLDHSMEQCEALGGEVISGPKAMGSTGRYCVIKDPAGAAMGLFEPA